MTTSEQTLRQHWAGVLAAAAGGDRQAQAALVDYPLAWALPPAPITITPLDSAGKVYEMGGLCGGDTHRVSVVGEDR